MDATSSPDMPSQNYLDWGATGIVDFGAELHGTTDHDVKIKMEQHTVLLPRTAGSDGEGLTRRARAPPPPPPPPQAMT